MGTTAKHDSQHPLAGRRALVTGGSRRLGRAMVLALAEAGADVTVHYGSDEAGARETAAAATKAGVRAHVVQADLRDLGACAALVEKTCQVLGGLDLLVNNAATFERTPLATLSAEDFDASMNVNARSVHALSLAAGRAMLADESLRDAAGDIVNLACVSAFRPYPGYVPYSASKAAVVSLTKGFAQMLAPRVRVNAIAPGPILPPTGEDPAQGERAVAATLLQRWGHPNDIVGALLFLLRARYITGYTLPVDGGRSIV